MSWTRIKLWGFTIGAIVVATACSPLGPAPSGTAPKVYLLQWEQTGRNAPTVRFNPACPTLLLSPPRAAPGYAGAGMAYMEEAHRIDYFAHHRWADSPARMLEPPLISALVMPTLSEWRSIRLPAGLRFLYYPYRWTRVLARALFS